MADDLKEVKPRTIEFDANVMLPVSTLGKSEKCTWINKKGARKGMTCDIAISNPSDKYCSAHMKYWKKENKGNIMEELSSLVPNEIVEEEEDVYLEEIPVIAPQKTPKKQEDEEVFFEFSVGDKAIKITMSKFFLTSLNVC